MATTMGPIGMVFKGAYDAAVEYQLLNVVTDGGNSYVYRALTAGTGKPLPVAPAETTDYWGLIASRGEAIEMRMHEGYVQYRREGSSEAWQNLFSTADITPTFAVGTVTTGAAGSAAAVEDIGEPGAIVLSLTIPRGDTGPQGPQGPQGERGPAGESPGDMLKKGVHDAHSAFSTFLQWFLNFRRWLEDRNVAFSAEFSSEVKSVALTNSAHFPFNNSKQTVALTTARNTLNYNVTYEIVSANGSVGDVQITDKQLNGFKIAFDGSATAVTIKVRIQGGMLV